MPMVTCLISVGRALRRSPPIASRYRFWSGSRKGLRPLQCYVRGKAWIELFTSDRLVLSRCLSDEIVANVVLTNPPISWWALWGLNLRPLPTEKNRSPVQAIPTTNACKTGSRHENCRDIWFREGLEKERATGALLFESYSLGLLADACIKNKRYGQALEFLRHVRLDKENTERFYAAEIYRLLGETYLRSNQNLDQAEQYFSKGLRLAREQNAKCFELRLCLSMCDLYDLQQNSNTYRSQLGETYGSFTEGHDTSDLVKAKASLESAR